MASAPSPSVPAAAVPPASLVPPVSPASSSSAPPPTVSTQPPSMSLPNATPDLPTPPLSSPPPLSSSSSPPPTTSPPPAPPLPSPPPPIIISPPPPDTTVPIVSAPPPQTTTTPSPPVTTSPPPPPPLSTLSSPPPPVPTSSSPPPSSPPTTKSPPAPTTPAQSHSPPPPPTLTLPPSSSPTPKPKPSVSPSHSSPPPSTPLSTSPPLPSPTTNSSVAKSPPIDASASASPPNPVSQFPLASPTGTTPPSSSQNGPTIAKNSNNGSLGSSGSSSGQSNGGEGLSAGAAASIAIVVVFLVASFVVAGVWYVKKKRRPVDGYNSVYIVPSPMMSSPKTGDNLSPLGQTSSTPFTTYHSNHTSGNLQKASLTDLSLCNSKHFTYEELHEITNGFSPSNILGEGGFGCVYRGRLPAGGGGGGGGDGRREVAVKRLTGGGGQGEREFQAEVEIISRVHHRHLVSLVGYCIQNEQRVLVYEYVPNNTLHFHLHGRGRPVLEWGIRVKIAAGAARGIAYLHEDCHPRIIHRDIKSSNILLDNDFEALVADFGLARLALDAVTHVTTRVMGTFGYLAPEYASSGKLTERSDVFSFGVVLLELITGRKPVDTSRPLGDESLVEWARPMLSQALETGKLEELIDPKLENNYNEVEMLRMIEAAAACVRHSASRRPRMSQVVRVLDSLADVDLTNGVQPGKSELFNVANSAEIRLFQKMAFGSQDYDYSSEFSQTSTSSTSQLNPNNRRDFHNLL